MLPACKIMLKDMLNVAHKKDTTNGSKKEKKMYRIYSKQKAFKHQ